MDEPTYLELLNMVSPHITKNDTCMREAITPNEILPIAIVILFTFYNDGRSLNSSTNSGKNSFDHVAMAERREKADISLCTWRWTD
jgi:hypothetical protein